MSPKHSYDESAQLKNRIMNFIINNSGEYGCGELADIFEVKSRTIQYYVKDYNEKGFVIVSRKGKYHVLGYPANFKTFKSNVNLEQLKKWIIYDRIKNFNVTGNGVDVNYFAELLFEENGSIADNKSYIVKLIYALNRKGYVYIENGKVRPFRNPLGVLDEKELLHILIYLNVIKNYYPSGEILHKVFRKFKLSYERHHKKKFNRGLAVAAHKHKISTYDESLIWTIENALTEGKFIEFEYKLKNKIRKNVEDIPEGLIYNAWKDTWYVVCGGERESLFRADKIINLKCGESIEGYEMHAFNKDLHSLSLGASFGNVEEVEVHFDKKDFILRKLKHYWTIRGNAELIFDEDKYILKDQVSGLSEFKKWVRSFGSGAKCIKPQELVDDIIDNIRVMKERYGVIDGQPE